MGTERDKSGQERACPQAPTLSPVRTWIIGENGIEGAQPPALTDFALGPADWKPNAKEGVQRGFHRRPDGEQRDAIIPLRVSYRERAQITAWAEQQGMNVSDALRAHLRPEFAKLFTEEDDAA